MDPTGQAASGRVRAAALRIKAGAETSKDVKRRKPPVYRGLFWKGPPISMAVRRVRACGMPRPPGSALRLGRYTAGIYCRETALTHTKPDIGRANLRTRFWNNKRDRKKPLFSTLSLSFRAQLHTTVMTVPAIVFVPANS